VSATRFSLLFISFGTPIIIMFRELCGDNV
jgi:hypothetical protein